MNGDLTSWEESQRQLIGQDFDLLQQFQVLKYINSEHVSTIMADAGD